jgi:hypothetical protein
LVRSIKTTETLPTDLDRDVGGALLGRAAEVAVGFAYSGLRSHVFLAACGEEELAQEFNGKGLFTSALLEILKAGGTDKLTYKDLIQRIRNIPG